jgi:tape measure domain-containing protein
MDIRQFAYAGIDIYGLLADSMGKSTAEIQDMVSKGKIGYKEISQALKKIGEKI